MNKFVLGPTFEEMLHPEKINPDVRKKAWEMRNKDHLDPINLYNITWKNINNEIYYVVLPKELTGVDANIIYLYGSEFPSGSHKVGATYSILMELVLKGEVDPSYHTLVWPSTGNYGIGGAWVGCRMKFDTVVILPEEMSKERFDLIEKYGARVIATPGCESNVKEIYDKAKELKAADPDRVRILNQFSEFGNYRFHYYVTGNTILELMNQLNIGNGRVSTVVAGVGSGGTIACGDRIKEVFPDAKNITLEPTQCPTISLNGYGGHDIQGIGDKHVTWIHNVMNNDAVVAVDDIESKKMLQVLTEPSGKEYLKNFINEKDVEILSKTLGISSVANIIGAIKMAKYYNMTSEDNIVTIATDNIDRYRTVMNQMTKDYGKLTESEAKHRYESMFLDAKKDWIFEGTMDNRKRWHNLKYYTWVEQQNKSVEELDSQKTREFWQREQNEVQKIDKLLLEYRKNK